MMVMKDMFVQQEEGGAGVGVSRSREAPVRERRRVVEGQAVSSRGNNSEGEKTREGMMYVQDIFVAGHVEQTSSGAAKTAVA